MMSEICRGCGRPLPDGATVCPNCDRPVGVILKARNWKCTNCGEMNGPERDTCWKCGKA
jgi:ribosomal protein L40E